MSLRRQWERRYGITLSIVWGASLKDNETGPAMYTDFLPAALAAGRYLPAPDPLVVGHGLEHIPAARQRLREGVSARKMTVTL